MSYLNAWFLGLVGEEPDGCDAGAVVVQGGEEAVVAARVEKVDQPVPEQAQ